MEFALTVLKVKDKQIFTYFFWLPRAPLEWRQRKVSSRFPQIPLWKLFFFLNVLLGFFIFFNFNIDFWVGMTRLGLISNVCCSVLTVFASWACLPAVLPSVMFLSSFHTGPHPLVLALELYFYEFYDFSPLLLL